MTGSFILFAFMSTNFYFAAKSGKNYFSYLVVRGYYGRIGVFIYVALLLTQRYCFSHSIAFVSSSNNLEGTFGNNSERKFFVSNFN
jgi:hypothetical protein